MPSPTRMGRAPAHSITEEELTEIERRALDYPDRAEILLLCREIRGLLSMSAPKEEQDESGQIFGEDRKRRSPPGRATTPGHEH